jgi:uncharacterized protein YwqG
MTKRHSIEFVEAKAPVREFVTKFGGQPVWVGESQWPLSRSTGKPMRFICQVALDPALFGTLEARMAYLFMTDDEEHVDGTWEPDYGENAVILQPGGATAPTAPVENGPTLYRMVKRLFQKRLVPEACEFGVRITEAEDLEFVSDEIRGAWSDEEGERYLEALLGNKIGGSPLFIQSDQFPGEGRWTLLLQLDASEVPFSINFGDAGVGYVFLSEDGKTAKFLWQCS